MKMLIMMNILLSSMFMLTSHPLSMGLILLLQTMMITMLTNFMSNQPWFSYILFLVFIGGMLILFIYMTSIASNEKFLFINKYKIMIMFIMSIMLTNMFNYMNSNLNLLNNQTEFLFMNKYFNYPNNMVMLMMIIYLFITLIATVKIINLKYGPMRQKN